MKKLSKVLALVLALCVVFTLAVGCGGSKTTDSEKTGTVENSQAASTEPTPVQKPPLKLRAVHRWNPNAQFFPQDTTLRDYVFKKINEYVGREVTCEWVTRPEDGTTYLQYLQMAVSANDTPDIFAYDDHYFFADAFDYGIKTNTYMPITADLLKANMPAYTKRLEYYGMDLEKDLLPANLWTDQKNWYIPQAMGSAMFNSPNLSPDYGYKQTYNYYSLAFRDDILKMIFPSARSEKEQLALLQANGKLTVDDITNDIPIKNREDMINYLRKVKALNLKVGDKPVIPGALNSSSQSVGSVKWSLQTAAGLGWRYPVIWTDPIENCYPIQHSDLWKNYMKWWNDMYNEGLLDPEIFVMKDDQYTAKMINGEYAVFNGWGPIEEARKVGAERGYGYRYLPAFHPIDMNDANNKYAAISLKAGTLFLNNNIKAEDVSDVFKFVDFFMSEESDVLAYWGHPDWYTGEGKDRRYKPEYKDLENWAVYGITGGKDGQYYGVAGSHDVAYLEGKGLQHDIKPFAFFPAGQWVYPDAPYYVYEKDPKILAEKLNVFTYSGDVMVKDYIRPNQVWYKEVGWSWTDCMTLPEWTKYETNLENNPDFAGMPIKIITEKPEKFEANWAAYQKAMEDAGVNEATKAVANFLKSVWDTKIIPNIMK